LLLGPWFIFKGPFLTYRAYITNKKGGLNVTKDIMLNLTQEDLNNNEVRIEKIHNIFSKLPKPEINDISKTIMKMDFKIIPHESIYVGLFDNVEECEEPYITMDVELENSIELNVEYIKEKLYKRFYNHVHFEIFDIKKVREFAEKLIEQGDLIRF